MTRCDSFVVHSCGMLPNVGTTTVLVIAYLGIDSSISLILWAVGAYFH